MASKHLQVQRVGILLLLVRNCNLAQRLIRHLTLWGQLQFWRFGAYWIQLLASSSQRMHRENIFLAMNLHATQWDSSGSHGWILMVFLSHMQRCYNHISDMCKTSSPCTMPSEVKRAPPIKIHWCLRWSHGITDNISSSPGEFFGLY